MVIIATAAGVKGEGGVAMLSLIKFLFFRILHLPHHLHALDP